MVSPLQARRNTSEAWELSLPGAEQKGPITVVAKRGIMGLGDLPHGLLSTLSPTVSEINSLHTYRQPECSCLLLHLWEENILWEARVDHESWGSKGNSKSWTLGKFPELWLQIRSRIRNHEERRGKGMRRLSSWKVPHQGPSSVTCYCWESDSHHNDHQGDKLFFYTHML